MTSQDSSCSPLGSGENIDKCLLSQEMKHARESVAENGHHKPATRDWHGGFHCSNDMNKTLSSDRVQNANHRKSDKERDLKLCKSDHEIYKLSISSSPVQKFNFSDSSILDVSHKLRALAVSSYISQKLPISTISSDVSHQLPMSAVSSDVSHRLPLSAINSDVSQKRPLSSITSDVSQKLPMAAINSDVCQKLTVSSNSSDVSEKLPLSAKSSNVSQKVPLSSISSNVPQKLPLSAVSSNVSQKLPLSSIRSNVSQKLPLSSIRSNVSQKLPLSSISSNVSQKLPLSAVSSNVSQKLPLSSISSDVSQKLPLSAVSSNVSQKLPLSSISSNVSQKLPLSAVSSNVSQKLPLSSISSDVSQKMQSSTIRSNVKKSNGSQMDNVCNKHVSKLQAKMAVGSARERYLSVVETENSSSSLSKACTVKSNHRRFESYLKDNIKKDSITKKNDSRDQVSNVLEAIDGSNQSPASVNTQGNFKKKYIAPRQLTKTSAALSIHATSSEGDCEGTFSKQVSQQKCRNCVSTSSSALRMMHCPSPDMQTSKPHPSVSSEILIPTTVKLLKSKFGGMDQRQECKITSASASNSGCTQNQHTLCTRGKIKPSYTIQRIQEQLFQKMENDEVRFSSSKTMQKLVHKTISEQNQEAETNVSELSGKSNGEHIDKLHKEEKPYRQWHRMSRVVTADSKFIISHMLPCHVTSYTKQNNPVPEKAVVESVKIEETVKTGEKKDRSVVKDLKDVTMVIDCYSCKRESETSDNTELLEAVVKTETAATEMPLTDDGMKSDGDTMQAEGGKYSLATTLHAPSDDGCKLQNKNQTAADTSDNTESSRNKQQIEQHNTFLNEPELRVQRIPKSIASVSMPRNKSLNFKTFHMIKNQSYNELHEVCASNTRDRHRCPLSTGVVANIQPLNSVSGASHVTGPSFSEFKNDSFKLPPKKVVSGGPKLRTATRSRNRCTSPSLIHGLTNVYRGSESQKAPINVSRHSSTHSREGSRNVSSDRGSGSVRQREQRMCTQPRYTRGARAQETESHNPECINRNWSSRCPATGEIQKESGGTLKRPRKVFLVDVASKLMQKVNRASIRVPRNEPTKKYTEVKATQDYNGSLPGQLSFRKGQIIKQRSFVAGPSDGMCYGYYRVGRLRKKKKGLFPITCVATEEPDALDEVSLTFSAKSAM